MNKIKVNDFVDAFARSRGLNNYMSNIIKEYMQKIILKYENIFPDGIPASVDNNVYFIKPVDGKYSIEDFLLNRLFRSIRKIVPESYDDEKCAQYCPSLSKIGYSEKKIYKSLVYSFSIYKDIRRFVFKNRNTIYDDFFKHVIEHEIGHALKTMYMGNYDCRFEEDYRMLYEELSSLDNYSDILTSYHKLEKTKDEDNYQSVYSGGMHNYVNGGYFYSDLNEIVNETETMECSGYNINLKRYLLDGGYIQYRNMGIKYNTNYGEMFRILFGDKNVFLTMYVDSEKGIKLFNNLYNDVLKSFYNTNKSACDILNSAVKMTYFNKKYILKLDEAFARCLEVKINRGFDNANISNNELLRQIRTFRYLCYSYDDKELNLKLNSHRILSKLERKVMSRKVSVKNDVYNKLLMYEKFHFYIDATLRKKYDEVFNNRNVSDEVLEQLALIIKENMDRYNTIKKDIQDYICASDEEKSYLDVLFDNKYSYELSKPSVINDIRKELHL